MTDRELAIEKLTEWRLLKSWARVDPRSLSITGVERTGPLQIILRSEYETRGVRYTLVPAAERDPRPPSPPDPWEQDLRHPDDATVGHESSALVPGPRVAMDCTTCSAAGQHRCARCDGMGRVQRGRASYQCDVCGGRGELRCNDCHATGGVLGTPTAWSRIESKEDLRASGADALPLEIALELGEASEPGELVHRIDASRIGELVGGGYRDGASLPGGLVEQIRALVEACRLPDRARLRRQIVEVRRTPVLAVTLANGTTLHVWGSPPKVFPTTPALTLLGRLFSR